MVSWCHDVLTVTDGRGASFFDIVQCVILIETNILSVKFVTYVGIYHYHNFASLFTLVPHGFSEIYVLTPYFRATQ